MAIRAKQLSLESNKGLEPGSTGGLQIKAGGSGDVVAVTVDSNGVGFDVSAIDGNGLTADGSGSLDVAGGMAGGDVVAATVSGSGVGFDVSAIDGNGLLADGGGELDVVGGTAGGDVVAATVTASGVGFDVSAVDGKGLLADGSGALDVGDGGKGVQVDADALVIDASEIAGDGLKQASDAWKLDIEPNDFAGTGLEDDGSDNMRLATQGTGIAGGNGSTLSIDTVSTVSFGANAVWTFPNGVTAKGLFVTGTPIDNNHVPNKAYVDSLVQGLGWTGPVDVFGLVGNVDVYGLVGKAAASVIEVLSVEGDAYVVLTADGSGALSAAAVGDIWQYESAAWGKIVTGAGGFVPDLTYALLNETTALITPYTDGTDDGKVVAFDGSDLDGTAASPNTGDSYVVEGSGATDEGDVLEYSGSAWVSIVTAAGGYTPVDTRAILRKAPALIAPYTEATDDNDIFEFAGDSHTAATTSEAADKSSVLIQDPGHVSIYDNLSFVLQAPSTVPTGAWVQIAGVSNATAGAGLAKGTGNVLDVGDAGKGVQVNADDVEIDASEIAGDGIKAGASSHLLAVDVSDFAGDGLEDDGSENLRLKATVAGDGLTHAAGVLTVVGGNGITANANDIAVTPGDLLKDGSAEVDGDLLDIDYAESNYTPATDGIASDVNHLSAHLEGIDVALDPATLIQGGAREVDGDLLDIDYAETNYTPATDGIATDVNHLAAHLEGIDVALANVTTMSEDDKNWTASVTAADEADASASGISNTPGGGGYVKVEINGIGVVVSYGDKLGACYFAASGVPGTARALGAIIATDQLQWNGTIAGYELDATDRIALFYEV